MYFARHGFAFVAVDVRGRGNSGGTFRPLIQEAQDGHDVVEWVARQPFCDGRVGMYGGSYLGYAQWVTAAKFPPHLVTIAPTAAPFAGIDVPMRNNIFSPYYSYWLTTLSGKVAQLRSSSDESLWKEKYRSWFESGRSIRDVDVVFGNPSNTFQEWLGHPELGPYWDSYNPTERAYSQLHIPILTITGAYDGDQPGALEHYRRHMRHATRDARARHFLVIGPWNHVGCALPCAEFEGLKIGAAGVLDMYDLHVEWYSWTMQNGPRPRLLCANVVYYVTGAEEWHYANSLEEVTAGTDPLYFQSFNNPTDIFASGSLAAQPQVDARPDCYVYDPRDVTCAKAESRLNSEMYLVDQTMIHELRGRRLIYHSGPLEQDTEISGFFKVIAWISIDQPCTDLRIWVHEIDLKGDSVLLSVDSLRARYRESTYEALPIRTLEPLRFQFDHFTFVSRLIKKGHRLRVIIGPINSIYEQKNYNSGNRVADESIEDARTVTVKLFHDADHPSAIYVPIGSSKCKSPPSKPDLGNLS